MRGGTTNPRLGALPPLLVGWSSLLLLLFFFGGSHATDDNAGIIVGCERLRETPQQIPDGAYWVSLRDAYVDVVGEDYSTIRWPPPKEEAESNDVPFTGFVVPIEVRQTTHKGRGVYATKPIPKGASVWDDRYHAVFDDNEEEEFKSLLQEVTWEQACDLLQWCYGYEYDANESKDEEDERITVGVACCLDEGSLLNHGVKGVANVGYRGKDDDNMVALVDIRAGEELIQDYGTFDESIEWFEDLIEDGWDLDEDDSEDLFEDGLGLDHDLLEDGMGLDHESNAEL